MRLFSAILFSLLLTVTACDRHHPRQGGPPQRIVALGDSLTAGYGLQPVEAYPAQLQEALQQDGYNISIDNAGVSGNTAADGLARLEQAIDGKDKPSLVIVALGANDMLRRNPPALMKDALRRILQSLKGKKIPAVLYGMKSSFIIPFSGSTYVDAYKDLAKEFDVPLYPFFLEGVVLDEKLNLGDGLHPNAAGVAVMVEKTKSFVEDALDDINR